MRDHVVYGSRLELTRLLCADFDQNVTAVFAQPFLLTTTVEGRKRSHVPDCLVLREKDVPLVVDVKPRRLPTRPKVNFARFLAGYRRGWPFDEDLLAEIRQADLHGATLGEAFHALPRHPDWKVWAAVLRLLWSRHFVTGLTEVLSQRHVLSQGPATVAGSGRRELPHPIDESELDDGDNEPAYRGISLGRTCERVSLGGLA